MDRKFDGLMKVLDERNYEHKYLEKEEVQGSGKRPRTLVECPTKTTLSQSARRIKNLSQHPAIKYLMQFFEREKTQALVEWPKDNQLVSRYQVNDVDFCLCNYAIWQK